MTDGESEAYKEMLAHIQKLEAYIEDVEMVTCDESSPVFESLICLSEKKAEALLKNKDERLKRWSSMIK